MKKLRIALYSFLAFFFCINFSDGQGTSASENDASFVFTVTSKAGKPRQGEVVFLKSKSSGKIFRGSTGTDGKCTISIPPSDTYTIFYKHFADTVKYKIIEVPGADHKVTYTLNLKFDPPKVWTLKNVFFDTGLSSIRKESFPALNELVEALKSKSSMVIEIAGHTDNVGQSEANQKLSSDRANAIRDYLIKHGIGPKRVIAKGYGETQPVASNDTPEGRQQNRRTEVRIISE
ncbi:MAG: OmpA family protein [Bacteroidota bacterium]|nr:OmpA family protein [Bacteroidota bacterium]